MLERPADWRQHVNLLCQTFSESVPDSRSLWSECYVYVFEQWEAELIDRSRNLLRLQDTITELPGESARRMRRTKIMRLRMNLRTGLEHKNFAFFRCRERRKWLIYKYAKSAKITLFSLGEVKSACWFQTYFSKYSMPFLKKKSKFKMADQWCHSGVLWLPLKWKFLDALHN